MDELSQIDLAFCVDLTRSMEPFIDAARRHVVTILAGLRSDARADLRVGLVGYRDHENQQSQGDLPIEVHPFTADDAEVHRALRALSVGAPPSNTDAAEAVFAGLVGALRDLKWRPQAFRIVVLIGDAPPHACGANAQPYPDRFPQRDPTGFTLTSLGGELEGGGIFLHALGMIPSVIPVHDSVLEAAFQRLAGSTGGTYRKAATAQDAIAVVEAIGKQVFREMGFDRMLWERLVAAAKVASPARAPAAIGAPPAAAAYAAPGAPPAPGHPAPAPQGYGAPPPAQAAGPAFGAPPPAAEPAPSAEDLASELGVPAEEVARSMARLKKRGIAPR